METATQTKGRKRFVAALRKFIEAGLEVDRTWDDDEDFNADEEFSFSDANGNCLFSASFDEWLFDLQMVIDKEPRNA